MRQNQHSVSARNVVIALLCTLSPFICAYVYSWTHPAREFSGPPPRTPTRIKWEARRNYLHGAVYAAIQGGDAPLALKRYARYNEVMGVNAWDPFLADDMRKMLWQQKRLPEARAAFREVLFPPEGASSSYGSNSVHWQDYAKLCDEMYLTEEARAARERANKLHQDAVNAKKSGSKS